MAKAGAAAVAAMEPTKFYHDIEVAAMEILPDTHALRHGKLKQFRPDLTPADCTFEKAFG